MRGIANSTLKKFESRKKK